jgi:hypothetical protein
MLKQLTDLRQDTKDKFLLPVPEAAAKEKLVPLKNNYGQSRCSVILIR